MKHKHDWQMKNKGINKNNTRLEAIYKCSSCGDEVTVSANA